MRHVAIAFAVASCSCSSCRETPRETPAVANDAAPEASIDASSSADAEAIEARSPSTRDAPWELVAKRKASDRPLWVAEVGAKVIVGDRSPLAWTEGTGPLVAAPHVAGEYVVGVAGTYPSAVFLANDKRVFHLAGEGWRDVGPLPPRAKAFVTWGQHGAVAVSSFIEGNSMPTLSPDERPATTLHAFVEETERKPVFDLEPGFGTFSAAGTRDGHLWLLGFRAGRQGMWLAHVVEGRKTGYQLYPGSEKCDDAGFGIYVYRSRIVATWGERAFLFVVNDAAECMGPIGTYLYERSEKGFAGIPLPKPPLESMSTSILGAARDGTLFFTPLEQSPLYRRDAESGKTTTVAVPKDCVAAQIVVRDDGDTWMTARCEGHDGVYRRGHPQAPLAL